MSPTPTGLLLPGALGWHSQNPRVPRGSELWGPPATSVPRLPPPLAVAQTLCGGLQCPRRNVRLPGTVLIPGAKVWHGSPQVGTNASQNTNKGGGGKVVTCVGAERFLHKEGLHQGQEYFCLKLKRVFF